MQLCSRCNAAIDVDRSHCPICDLPVPGPAFDHTRVQGGPRPPVAGAPVPWNGPPVPPYVPVHGPPGHGYGAAPLPPARSKVAAALLCFFFGYLGIHRFYTGQTGLGMALLLTTLILGTLTCGLWLAVTFVWVLVDFVLILTGGVKDQWGRPLV